MASTRTLSRNVAKLDDFSEDMRKQGLLLQRFASVRGFMVAREITQYVPVSTAIDPTLSEYADRMRKLWNGDARIQTEDETIISKLENVCDVLREQAA